VVNSGMPPFSSWIRHYSIATSLSRCISSNKQWQLWQHGSFSLPFRPLLLPSVGLGVVASSRPLLAEKRVKRPALAFRRHGRILNEYSILSERVVHCSADSEDLRRMVYLSSLLGKNEKEDAWRSAGISGEDAYKDWKVRYYRNLIAVHPIAGGLRRLVAEIIDSAVGLCLISSVSYFYGRKEGWMAANLYYLFRDTNGVSIGKWFMGIEVLRICDRSLSLMTSVWRNCYGTAGSSFVLLFAMTGMCIDTCLYLITPSGRSLGDRLAGTVVVRSHAHAG